LALIEKPLLPLLPLTAGQLASFANDGVAQPHPLVAKFLPRQRTAPRKPEAPPPAPPAPVDDATLEREAHRFVAYVASAKPSAYQVGKYLDFHRQRPIGPVNGFDAWLTNLARSNGLGLALADAYSGLLFRTSLVRQKLVVGLGVAEASGDTAARIDKADAGFLPAFAKMSLQGALAVLTLAASLVVLAPMHIMLGRRSAVG
jgi:hypothetical protein